MFKKFEINNGFLKVESYIDKAWIKKTLQDDEKFQEIITVAGDKKDISLMLEVGLSIANKAKNIVIVGIGGSNLAAKAFFYAKKEHENFPKNNIYFIDNLSSNSVDNILKKINIKESFFLFISKSGNTIETVSQMILITDYLKSSGLLSREIVDICLSMTAKKESYIGKISQEFGIEILDWSGDVSGRFSAFSNNINLINVICGIDIKKNLKYFLDLIDKLTESDEFLDRINFTISAMKNNISSTILFCYNENLRYFIDWYIQLWAESIGKNGLGTNPCGAIGPLDQHSKLQLYLGGPRDKIFTIINPVSHKKTTLHSSSIKELSGVNIEKIVDAAANGTFLSLQEQNLPCNIINCEIDDKFITKMMTFYILETILSCHYFKINPYDQPEVEASKKYMRNAIGV